MYSEQMSNITDSRILSDISYVGKTLYLVIISSATYTSVQRLQEPRSRPRTSIYVVCLSVCLSSVGGGKNVKRKHGQTHLSLPGCMATAGNVTNYSVSLKSYEYRKPVHVASVLPAAQLQ